MNHTGSRRNFLKGKFSVFIIKSQLLLAVYWFPIATLTNYRKLSGSKQHKFIILQLCRSEVHSESWWAQIKVLAGLCSFPEDLKGRMQVVFFFTFASFWRLPVFGSCMVLFHFQSQQWLVQCFSHHFASSLLCLPLPPPRTLVIALGPPG